MTTATLNRMTDLGRRPKTAPAAEGSAPTAAERFRLDGVSFLLGSIAMTMLVMVGIFWWTSSSF